MKTIILQIKLLSYLRATEYISAVASAMTDTYRNRPVFVLDRFVGMSYSHYSTIIDVVFIPGIYIRSDLASLAHSLYNIML